MGEDLRCNWGDQYQAEGADEENNQTDGSRLKMKYKGNADGVKVYQVIKGVSNGDFLNVTYKERVQCVARYIKNTSRFPNGAKLYYTDGNEDADEIYICQCQDSPTNPVPFRSEDESSTTDTSSRTGEQTADQSIGEAISDGSSAGTGGSAGTQPTSTGSSQTASASSCSQENYCGDNYNKGCYNHNHNSGISCRRDPLNRLPQNHRRYYTLGWGLPVAANTPITSHFGSAVCGRTDEDRERWCPEAYAFGCHRGIDFGGSCGAEIRAIADGTAYIPDESLSWGKHIRLVHSNDNYISYYAHLNSFDVESGDSSIKKGDIIGRMGNTGTYGETPSGECFNESIGVHLHLEIWEKIPPNRQREDYPMARDFVDPSQLQEWRYVYEDRQTKINAGDKNTLLRGKCSLAQW